MTKSRLGNWIKGFTLIELLIVIAVVAILLAMLFPLVSSFMDRARSARCVSNLRAIGHALFAHAAEHDGKTLTAFDLDPVTAVAGNMWPDALRTQGYLTLAEEKKIMVCPTYAPYQYSSVGYSTRAYGLRRISEPWDRRFEPAFTAAKVSKPASYIVLADSVMASTKNQFYYLDYPGFAAKPDQIHLRHNNKANIFFGDGSVRSLGKQDILDLGDGWNSNAICEGDP